MATNAVLAKLAIQISANTTELGKALSQSQSQLKGFQNAVLNVGRALGVSIGAAALVQGLKHVVGVAAEFEHTMSELKAITGATGSEFDALSKDALRLGSSTKFTASEVGKLQVAFGRLGFNTKEIIDATEATLDLAAATGEDLAKSADVAGSTVRGFGLEARETQRVVDVMAESFNKTALGLENFTESMKYVAPIAEAANVSVEETTALLGVLADAGIRGSQAGTALRKIFGDLSKDGRPVAERLDELGKKGITLKDSFDEVGRTAQTALLVLSKNRDKTAELTRAFGDAEGAAASMARVMQDDLIGDTTKLTSAFEGLFLKLTSTSALRDLTQALTGIVNALNGTSGDVISGLDQLAKGVKDGVTEANGGFQLLIDKLAEVRKESGKPIDTRVAQELADKYKLTEEQANVLYRAIIKINKSLSDQEVTIKRFEDFKFGGELSRQLEQLKIDRASAFTTDEVKEFDKRIAELTTKLEEHKKKFGDVGFAADTYKQRIYQLILAEQRRKAGLEEAASISETAKRGLQGQIDASSKQIADYQRVIAIINEYVDAATSGESKVQEATEKTVLNLNFYQEALKKLNAAFEALPLKTDLEVNLKIGDNTYKELNRLTEDTLTNLRVFAAEGAGLDEFIKRVNRIKDSFKDLDTFIKPPDTSALNQIFDTTIGKLKEFKNEFGTLTHTATIMEAVTARIEASMKKLVRSTETATKTITLDFAPLINNALSGIGQALGSAIGGGEDFGRALLGVLGGILVQLGEMLIAAGVGVIAFKKSLTSLQGPIAIVAGVALVALGTAVGARIKKLGSSASGATSSGGGASASTPSRFQAEAREQRIDLSGTFRVDGRDLVLVLDNQSIAKNRLG